MVHKDKEVRKEYLKNYYKDNPEGYQWRGRLSRHGITAEDFYILIEKQDGRCKICEKPFIGFWGKDCHVDHCHETNKIRGLLCMPCNVGLGMLGDNEKGLAKALAYVKGELE